MRYSMVMVLILAMSFPAIVLAQPAIVFDEVSHDFGDIDQGEQLEYVFGVRNSGTEELVIERLVPS